jgi:hypothetical protein
MKRKAAAVWEGGLEDGKGRLTTGSGMLRGTQYSFATRFESGVGTGCPVSRVLNAKITMDARLEG